LVIAIAIAVSPASAQTTQSPQMAYVEFLYCPLVTGASDCSGDPSLPPTFAYITATPYGWFEGPGDTQPTWSPDAQQIAFTHSNDIFVLDAAGFSSAVNITNTANNLDPAWSPDGTRIAFTSTRDGHSELYLMNPDGANVVRLTNNFASNIGHPAWSHDGRRIAFNCQVETGNDDICAINSDGTGFVRLTSDPATDGGPTWSPDDAQIAFATTRYGTNTNIAVMNADGSGVRQVGAGVIGYGPAWSPDGAQIAFDGNPADPSSAVFVAIHTMQADGTGVALLVDSAQDPAWMPMRVPVATFKVSCNGTTCKFDATGSKDSYGTITSYAWSFGDQATGLGATVTHTYAGGGAYTAKLAVTDSNGAAGTKFQSITIYPVPSFTYSCSGLTCSFDGSGSKDLSAPITGYTWDFGDGVSRAGVVVSHTYSAGNSYKVKLTVIDTAGATGSQSQTINVNTPPVASFTFACNLLTCSFDGSGSRDSDGTVTSFTWDFGDHTTASGSSVSHSYAAGGQYTVTLTVTDNGGASNSQTQTVIANSPPVASFTFSCGRFTCSFDGSSSRDADGTITNYAWKFGDGTTGSGATVTHTYALPRTYTVTLTVKDNGGATGVQTNSVTVVRPK
jgi:PKD repeat protein